MVAGPVAMAPPKYAEQSVNVEEVMVIALFEKIAPPPPAEQLVNIEEVIVAEPEGTEMAPPPAPTEQSVKNPFHQ